MRQRGILVRDRSADPGCEGCVRITIGTTRKRTADRRAGRSRRWAEAGQRGDGMRRARIHRKTNETEIRVALTMEGHGRAKIATGIRFLDHMLELVARHGAFDLEARSHRRSRCRSAPHGRGCRHCAGRGIRTGAGQQARHPARRIFRDAHGRNSWRGRGRFRWTQRGRGRHQGSHTTGRRSANGTWWPTSSMASRGARRPTCMPRYSTAAPIITKSKRCSRLSLAPCAWPAAKIASSDACCPARKDCCDCHHRLRRGKSGLGGEGHEASGTRVRSDRRCRQGASRGESDHPRRRQFRGNAAFE